MGDFEQIFSMALKYYLLCALFWGGVVYGCLRLFHLHPLTTLGSWLGL